MKPRQIQVELWEHSKLSNIIYNQALVTKSLIRIMRYSILFIIVFGQFAILHCSGYMAPEYAMYGQFSVKSDVFSFGILALEIVSGQRNNCFRYGENVEDLASSVSLIMFMYTIAFFLRYQ